MRRNVQPKERLHVTIDGTIMSLVREELKDPVRPHRMADPDRADEMQKLLEVEKYGFDKRNA